VWRSERGWGYVDGVVCEYKQTFHSFSPCAHTHTHTPTPTMAHMHRSFCENYDMQEHSSKIFCDIISAMGGFIQSNFAILSPVVQLPFGPSFGMASSPSVTNNSAASHVTSSVPGSGHHTHLFSIRNVSLQVESLPPNTHHKPT